MRTAAERRLVRQMARARQENRRLHDLVREMRHALLEGQQLTAEANGRITKALLRAVSI